MYLVCVLAVYTTGTATTPAHETATHYAKARQHCPQGRTGRPHSPTSSMRAPLWRQLDICCPSRRPFRPPRLCARRASVSRSDHATTPREAAPRHRGRPSRRRGRRREDRLVERRECARGRGKTSHIEPNPRGHGEAGFIEAGRRRLGRNLPTRRAATTAAVAAVWAAHPSLRSRRPGSRNHLASRSRRAQTRPCTARRCLAATPRAHRPHGPRARS